MELSIIIPVYNMEKYLEECLNSIFSNKNTDGEYEVICINDGSTDSSLDILNTLLEKYKDRLKVINIENAGVSNARNIGIKEAKGKYITFVDSDDWVSEDFIENIFKSITNNPECELFIFNTIFAGKREYIHKEYIQDTIYNTENHACCKVFKSNIVKENNILFPINIKLGEDMVFTFKYIFYIEKYIHINSPIYYYRCNREGSTMTSEISSVYKQIFIACDELYNYCINKNLISNVKDELEYLFIKNIIIRNTPKIVKSNKSIKGIINEVDEEINYMNSKFINWQNNKYIKQDADKYCSGKLGKYYKDVLYNLRIKKYIKVLYYVTKGKLIGG